MTTSPKTIDRPFDARFDVPDWVRREPEVLRFAERNLAFRIECWTETARRSKREQKRLAGVAHRVLDYRHDLA